MYHLMYTAVYVLSLLVVLGYYSDVTSGDASKLHFMCFYCTVRVPLWVWVIYIIAASHNPACSAESNTLHSKQN